MAVSAVLCLIMSAVFAMLSEKIGKIVGAPTLEMGVASYLQIFKVYYKCSYTTDKEELNRKVAEGSEEILPATPW